MALVAGVAARGRAVENVTPPRSLAMGDSLRAAPEGATALLENPAGLARERRFSIEAFYGFRAQDTGSAFDVALADAIGARLAIGAYYTYVRSGPRFDLAPLGDVTAARAGHETGLALAVTLSKHASLGVAARYLDLATTAADPASPAASAAPLTLDATGAGVGAGFTADVGLSLRFGPVDVGLVGYHLVPVRSVEAPLAAAAAVAWRARPSLLLALDTVVPFDRYRDPATGAARPSARVGGGLEWLVAGRLPLRAGALWDGGRPGAWVSAGLGWLGRSFAIDLAYRQQLLGGLDSTVVAGARVFVD